MILSRRSALMSVGALSLPRPALSAADTPASSMMLGVNTHFDQGWNLRLMNVARSVGANTARDTLPWGKIEKVKGQYDFDPYHADFVDRARQDGLDLLMCLDPVHPLYDDGKTAFSQEARDAYADYINVLLDRYSDVVSVIEVGNEINGEGGMTGPAAEHRAESHVALLRTIYERVKPRHPSVIILGGSVNVIGIGFLSRIFEVGGLEVMDGVAIHPYRGQAEHLDDEIEMVRAEMRRFGPERAIYATEFGNEVDDPEILSPHLLKLAVIMGASDVKRAYWYVLIDEPWFRNMGLFTPQLREKPAGQTFAFIAQTLIAHGNPTRVKINDLTFLYRYPNGTAVVWGSPRAVTVSSGQAFDARGNAIALPNILSETPIVITGAGDFTFGRPDYVADSFLQFGKAPWSYFAETSDGALRPLDWVYWDWTSYIGARNLQPFSITSGGIAPTGEGANPIRAVVRYTAPSAAKLRLQAEFSLNASEDGVDVTLRQGATVLKSLIVHDTATITDLEILVEAGDHLDLVVGPNQTYSGETMAWRIRLSDTAP